MSVLDVTVRATKYTVAAALPDDFPGRNHWCVYVMAGRGDTYYVTDGFQPAGYYSRSSARDRHPDVSYPSDRSSEWFVKTYLMPLDEAIALAKRIVPKLTINNMTAEQFVARVEASRAAEEAGVSGG